MDFNELWAKFPRKVAKKAAEKAYNRAVKTISPEVISASLDLMLELEWKHREPQYIPHMASWLNRECFEERPEAIEDEEPQNGHHRCDVCPTPHDWSEAGEPLNWAQQRILACPEARDAMRKAISSGLQRVAAGKGM